MADDSVSERKRSRLQALERRLSPSSPPPAKKTTAATSLTSPSPPPRPNSTAKPSIGGDFQGPSYAKLTKLALNGPVASHLQLFAGENVGNAIDSIIRDLVQESGKAVRDLDSVLDSKVQDRVLLLDNPARHGKAVERARRRVKQSLAKRSNTHLSKHQQKLIGSYDLPSQYRKFDLFLPMHEMWKAYAKRVVEDNRGKMIEPSLLQMDLHGAFLAVVEAKIDNQVGVEGIMIRETTNTFAIVTTANKIKVIPKAGSVFIFRLDDMCVTLYGDRVSSGKGVTEKT